MLSDLNAKSIALSAPTGPNNAWWTISLIVELEIPRHSHPPGPPVTPQRVAGRCFPTGTSRQGGAAGGGRS